MSGDIKAFVSDIKHLGHPPGYPLLVAGIFKAFGASDTTLQVVQIFCDAAAAVLLFMIALELLPVAVAVIAGVLAAISPQFAYFSVLLLPDSLAVVPILMAVYFLLRARRHSGLLDFAIAGALIGISCWLRANALLLAPFLAAFTPLLVERGKRLRAASAVIAGALLVITPITLKNAIVFHRFVPLSLGAGQTLLEGIADYDEARRFNIPNTDLGIMRQEADWYGKPEYAQVLFGKDGIKRDRMRLARGFAVIRSHPFWFASVMMRRAIASTRLDPVPLLAPESPVSHDFAHAKMTPVWTNSTQELAGKGASSPQATLTLVNDQWLRIDGDQTKYGSQKASEIINVRKGHDYVLYLPLKLEEGRMLVKITGAGQEKVVASVGVDLVEGASDQEQPVRNLAVPFVSASNHHVRLVIANFASQHPVVLVGPVKLVELGPSSNQWLRYLRIPISFAQRLFTTSWFLPLVVIGGVLLIRKRQVRCLAIILAVPAYYLFVQSALHTERRYVYVIHFFFLMLASVTLWWLVGVARSGLSRVSRGWQSSRSAIPRATTAVPKE